MLKLISGICVCTIILSACQQGVGQKQGAGTLIGAGLGALAGSQIGSGKGQLAAVAIGTVFGAFMGNEIGKSLDKADRALHAEAGEQAQSAQIGETIKWNNPKSGNSGTITPMREGRSRTGSYCREFQQTVTIGRKTEEAFGTACRQPDGSWKIVS